MIYLSNAFSLQMLPLECVSDIKATPVTKEEVAQSDFTSVVGHLDTANVLTDLLGKKVTCNRVNLALEPHDVLYVAQLVGGRLPEGATMLPEGYEFKFVRVELSN